MIKAIITNINTGRQWQPQGFETEQEFNSWFSEKNKQPNRPWGKPERWVLGKYEESTGNTIYPDGYYSPEEVLEERPKTEIKTTVIDGAVFLYTR